MRIRVEPRRRRRWARRREPRRKRACAHPPDPRIPPPDASADDADQGFDVRGIPHGGHAGGGMNEPGRRRRTPNDGAPWPGPRVTSQGRRWSSSNDTSNSSWPRRSTGCPRGRGTTRQSRSPRATGARDGARHESRGVEHGGSIALSPKQARCIALSKRRDSRGKDGWSEGRVGRADDAFGPGVTQAERIVEVAVARPEGDELVIESSGRDIDSPAGSPGGSAQGTLADSPRLSATCSRVR